MGDNMRHLSFLQICHHFDSSQSRLWVADMYRKHLNGCFCIIPHTFHCHFIFLFVIFDTNIKKLVSRPEAVVISLPYRAVKLSYQSCLSHSKTFWREENWGKERKTFTLPSGTEASAWPLCWPLCLLQESTSWTSSRPWLVRSWRWRWCRSPIWGMSWSPSSTTWWTGSRDAVAISNRCLMAAKNRFFAQRSTLTHIHPFI